MEEFEGLDAEIKEMVASLNLRHTVTELAELMKMSKSSVSDVLNGKRDPTDKFKRILRSVTTNRTGEQNVLSNLVEEDAVPYLVHRRQMKNTAEKKNVPVFGGYTNLSNIVVYRDDPAENEIIATLPANMFPGCDHAEKAKGDSMYPLIVNQSWLVGQKCGVKGIVMGEKYIIKTRHGLDTTKFVHPFKREGVTDFSKLILKAHNKNVPDQEIDVTDIVFACRVNFIINPT